MDIDDERHGDGNVIECQGFLILGIVIARLSYGVWVILLLKFCKLNQKLLTDGCVSPLMIEGMSLMKQLKMAGPWSLNWETPVVISCGSDYHNHFLLAEEWLQQLECSLFGAHWLWIYHGSLCHTQSSTALILRAITLTSVLQFSSSIHVCIKNVLKSEAKWSWWNPKLRIGEQVIGE